MSSGGQGRYEFSFISGTAAKQVQERDGSAKNGHPERAKETGNGQRFSMTKVKIEMVEWMEGGSSQVVVTALTPLPIYRHTCGWQ